MDYNQSIYVTVKFYVSCIKNHEKKLNELRAGLYWGPLIFALFYDRE